MKKVNFSSMQNVRYKIQKCSDYSHVQQVAYSTYHDGITQVCFDCETVRTSIEK